MGLNQIRREIRGMAPTMTLHNAFVLFCIGGAMHTVTSLGGRLSATFGITLLFGFSLLAGGRAPAGLLRAVHTQTPAPINDTHTTPEEFDRWMHERSNWGRWGKADELGAINLITPSKRRTAAALATTGEVVSLAHNLLTEKAADASTPFQLLVRIDVRALYAYDKEEIDFHGSTFSHLDSLCHVSYQG